MIFFDPSLLKLILLYDLSYLAAINKLIIKKFQICLLK